MTTNSLTSNEQDEQLMSAESIVNAFESLRSSKSLIDVEVSYDYLRGAILKAQSDAATAMRDKCVEKVREYLTDCREEECGIIEAIASQLQSLTLDTEQKK